VVDFQSDYRLSDTSSALNPSSLVVKAVGGGSNCTGMGAPNNIHYNNTYYPSPMYAAEAALEQEQIAFPGSQNVMIIVGDGDANTPQTDGGSTVIMPSPATSNARYPSWLGECGQGVTAAQSFTNTIVYTVAYGSPTSGGCVTDQDAAFSGSNKSAYPNIQPCTELSLMATHSWTFFSDYTQSGTSSNCIAAQAESSLTGIFLQIAGDLTEARLVSDNTP
jgi:hypothetical protein